MKSTSILCAVSGGVVIVSLNAKIGASPASSNCFVRRSLLFAASI